MHTLNNTQHVWYIIAMFDCGMIKLMILLLTRPFIEFDYLRYRFSSEKNFLLTNLRKIDRTFKSVRAIHSVRSIRVRPTEVWLFYGFLILVLWGQTSSHNEMIYSCKSFLHVSKLWTLTYNWVRWVYSDNLIKLISN